MQELEFLQQKLSQLLKRFTALQADNERLGKTVKQQEQIIASQTEKISTLEQELQSKSVIDSAAGTDEVQKQKLKKHLDNVIKEIEKNLEML